MSPQDPGPGRRTSAAAPRREGPPPQHLRPFLLHLLHLNSPDPSCHGPQAGSGGLEAAAAPPRRPPLCDARRRSSPRGGRGSRSPPRAAMQPGTGGETDRRPRHVPASASRLLHRSLSRRSPRDAAGNPAATTLRRAGALTHTGRPPRPSCRVCIRQSPPASYTLPPPPHAAAAWPPRAVAAAAAARRLCAGQAEDAPLQRPRPERDRRAGSGRAGPGHQGV